MTTTAVILLLISAVTHAGWNFLSKKEYPTPAFYFAANTFGVICVLPIIPYYWSLIPMIPDLVWIFVAISGFFLAAYMVALAGAYRTGDISIAYPLARSLPVIFVFVLTTILRTGDDLGVWAILGMILVVAGCITLPMKSWHDFHILNYKNLCCLLAVMAAFGISGYTITDNEALRHLRNLPGAPFDPLDATLIYMVLEGISCSIWQFVLAIFSAGERKNMIVVLQNYKSSAAITGIGIYLTYGLVLASMNFVTNISYVAAFRQLSIPLGAIFGMALLREPRYLAKIFGVITIFIGLALVKMG
jgi:drug/metabolite transporter (DMT)-like permease